MNDQIKSTPMQYEDLRSENRAVPHPPADPWRHRSGGMRCGTCLWFAPKASERLGDMSEIGRCRRHAPTMNGYPVVYRIDWCGDHKLDENKI